MQFKNSSGVLLRTKSTAPQNPSFARVTSRGSVSPTKRHWVIVQAGSSRYRRSLRDKNAIREPAGASRTAPADQQQEWLAKALAAAGVASRRNCIELIKEGVVEVNGIVIKDPATKVGSKDAIAVKGHLLQQQEEKTCYYFAVNKPRGYICSNSSERAPDKRAVDLLQPWLDIWQKKHPGQLLPRLFNVGRLDVATSGLIFLTNDGDWANKVIHPSANLTKEYHVTLPTCPTPQQLQLLRAGAKVEGVHCQPKLVAVITQSANNISGSSSKKGSSNASGRSVVRVDVSEGKKHEVRVLVASAGLQLLSLKRVRVGGYVLPRDVPLGGYRELSPADLTKVLSDSMAQQ